MPQQLPMQGLFGASPQDVYLAQQQQIDQRAKDVANMDGLTAAKYAMGQVGGGLARPVAGMLGLKNPQMEQAEQEQEVQSQIDHSTPEGLLEGAAKFNQMGNTKMAMMYYQAAQALQKQADEAALTEAQTQQALAKANEVKAAPTRTYERNGVKITEEMQPDGTWTELGSSPVRTGSQAANNGNWIDSERSGIRGQENTVTGEFKPYPGQAMEKPMTELQRLKLEQGRREAAASLRSLEGQVSTLASKADALKNHPGLPRITGAMGMAPNAPGSDASKAQALLDEFKASTKMVGLQLVREGGSIGAMTEKEWPIVESMVANIDPSGDADFVKDQIDKVIAKMEQLKSNAKATYKDSTSEFGEAPAAPAPAGGAAVRFTRGPDGKLMRVQQ